MTAYVIKYANRLYSLHYQRKHTPDDWPNNDAIAQRSNITDLYNIISLLDIPIANLDQQQVRKSLRIK